MIARKKDWTRLMAAAIAERRTLPFQWGVHDCGHSTATIVLAFTGTDLLAKFRGSYSTAIGAQRLYESHGGYESFVESICAEHGLKEIKPAFAQRGDIALFLSVPCVAIVDGANSFAPAEDGLRSLNTQTADRAWRIPFMSF